MTETLPPSMLASFGGQFAEAPDGEDASLFAQALAGADVSQLVQSSDQASDSGAQTT